jgi:adenylate cyclase
MLVPSLWKLALLLVGPVAAIVFFVTLSFQKDLWVDGVLLSANLGLSFVMSTAFSYATEGRQRRQIKNMFSRYMSDLLIQDLLKNPDKPDWAKRVKNRFATAIDIILASGGLMTNMKEDAIMAFGGAPFPEDHAVRACLAALDNWSAWDLRRSFAAGFRRFMRIGISTGEMIIGNMGQASGSTSRLSATA